MKKISTAAAVAAALVVTGCSTSGTSHPGVAGTAHKPKGLHDLTSSFQHNLTLGYAAQTARVQTDCFPTELQAVLTGLGAKFGKKPVVTSGYRPKAGKSQHAKCKAADIRIPGVKPSAIAAYARSIKGIGGVGTYCGTGIVHVDVGPKRDWRHC